LTFSRNRKHGNTLFLKIQNQSRKRSLEEALGLCAVANKKGRKGDEQRDSSWWRSGDLNWDDKVLQG